MEVPWRFVLYTFATAFATACLLACKGQASDTNEDSTTTQRKLQQQGSFSPFDTSSKPYGYGRGPNGRHLLAYGPAPGYTSSQVLSHTTHDTIVVFNAYGGTIFCQHDLLLLGPSSHKPLHM